jgi:hypothetical protein
MVTIVTKYMHTKNKIQCDVNYQLNILQQNHQERRLLY